MYNVRKNRAVEDIKYVHELNAKQRSTRIKANKKDNKNPEKTEGFSIAVNM